MALDLLGLVFAGMFLNDRYDIPAWILALAGVAAAAGLHVSQRHAFRRLVLRHPRHPRPRPWRESGVGRDKGWIGVGSNGDDPGTNTAADFEQNRRKYRKARKQLGTGAARAPKRRES